MFNICAWLILALCSLDMVLTVLQLCGKPTVVHEQRRHAELCVGFFWAGFSTSYLETLLFHPVQSTFSLLSGSVLWSATAGPMVMHAVSIYYVGAWSFPSTWGTMQATQTTGPLR